MISWGAIPNTDILPPTSYTNLVVPWDTVASLSPCHSCQPSCVHPAATRSIEGFAPLSRPVMRVAKGHHGPPWFIEGCSTCGQWLENALKASPGKEYGNGSSKIVYKPASDDSWLFVQLFLDPVQIPPSHMPLILFMKELVYQEIAGLTLDKSALVTI